MCVLLSWILARSSAHSHFTSLHTLPDRNPLPHFLHVVVTPCILCLVVIVILVDNNTNCVVEGCGRVPMRRIHRDEIALSLSHSMYVLLLHIVSYALRTGARTSAIMDMSLMRIFNAGPDVSLNGSPTVSPVTAALWHSEPLPPW